MNGLELKTYQREALDALRTYLRRASELNNADTAFYECTRQVYHPVPELPKIPYVCLRIPTGGGKTLMAAHAVSIAAQEALRRERCVALWLVPTTTIKAQTLKALRDLEHPYRLALEETLDHRVTVMDLEEAQHLSRAKLEGTSVIIVSTVAAHRVEETEERRVYAENGGLMAHFEGLTDAESALLRTYEGTTKPVPSLENLFRLRHPVVIVDEAHNARTDLSFATLARFSPSCILEFTATPRQDEPPSNVLYHCHAYRLKTEHMIKLPIRLESLPEWKQALAAAIRQQEQLETVAREEQAAGQEYLRPIVLVQAEKRSQHAETLTVEVVKQGLMDLGVTPERIAIETGTAGEVSAWEDANRKTIFDESCPIRFIITVDKLREGWDCSFAYVLCSVRDMRAAGAVEQILGRVLRMPKATERPHDELNRAYAFVTSPRTANAARAVEGVADALEENGFARWEALAAIEQPQLPIAIPGGLFAQRPARRAPSEDGLPFVVPQLAFWSDGELEALDDDHFLPFSWKLAQCVAALSEAEFPKNLVRADGTEIDVNKEGRLIIQRVADVSLTTLQCQLALSAPAEVTTPAELALWLDEHIPHPDIVATQSRLFLLNLVGHLIAERGFTLDQLSRERLRLRDAAAAKINQHRQRAKLTAYNQWLFNQPATELEVSAKCVFQYAPKNYPVTELYEGPYQFAKHYYPLVGAMNGEEARLAQLLDSLPRVKYWVRNLERRPYWSFWLPTSTDKFYPDFVALLDGDKVLAVEYKGARDLTTDDTKEKRKLGDLWATKSKGRCLFVLASEQDYEQQLRLLAG